MAIVKEIVQAHGGRVEVQSQVGKGSSFWVILPIMDGQPDSSNRP